MARARGKRAIATTTQTGIESETAATIEQRFQSAEQRKLDLHQAISTAKEFDKSEWQDALNNLAPCH